MPTSSDRLFALPAVRTLLDLELADLAPQLAGVYGAQGLFVRAHAGAPKVVSAPMLGRLVRLHVESPEHFGGDAACAETDPEAWFPEKGDVDLRRIKRICAGCQVRAECLEWALDNREQHGVWGGTTPRQRRRIRALRLAGSAA